jgi:hypothetical protein
MLSNSEAARQARSEAARHAIESRWAKTTDPAQRKAQTQPGRIASAVKVVVENWPRAAARAGGPPSRPAPAGRGWSRWPLTKKSPHRPAGRLPGTAPGPG